MKAMHNNEELIGVTLNDRYKIIKKIGTGGMALVYKAHDIVLDRDVAIKMLRDNYESESSIALNFITEARSSASLVHPNVVSVYDVSDHDGYNYMVMELVNGKTLKEYIEKSDRLPWQEACNYTIQIGQGIQAAHERNIIHRDIKPQNIIMDSSGTLKVTDFGIAKAVEGEKTIAGGTAMGSVHYISPEQARGGFTDFRSDIYSLGVVLYEMLAGRVPFDGDDPVSVALKHIEEKAINVKCINMDVPSDLAYVTMKAMNREPGKRYQCMKDFLDDLRAVLADEILPSKDRDRKMGVFTDEDTELNEKNKPDNNEKNRRVREKGKAKVVKKKSERNAILLAFATAIAFVLIIVGIISLVSNAFSTTVPDFSYMTVEEAKKEARRHGFSIEYEYTYSDLVAKDHVIFQIPLAGETLDKHEKIKISVSMGATGGKIEVPNFEGVTLEYAKKEIDALKLSCKVEIVNSATEAGVVIRQTPVAGTHMNPAGEVKLYVSSGPKETPVITENPEDNDSSQDETSEKNPDDDAPASTESEKQTATPVKTESPRLPESVATPAPTPQATALVKFKIYSVSIPDDADENVHVKIVVNGEVIHNSTHSKSEGKVVQEISGSGTVKVQTFIDGVLVNEESLSF